MLLWLLNLGFGGGGGIIPPPPTTDSVYVEPVKNASGGGSATRHKEDVFLKQLMQEDEEIFELIQNWTKFIL